MSKNFLSHSDAALRNRNIVLHYIKENAPVSRTDIWENLDMSRAAVTQILKQFQENGLIIDCFHGKSTGGRKPLYIEFDGKNNIFFAFDWTAKNLYLMNLNGDILYESPLKIPENISPEMFASIVKESIQSIMDEHHYEADNLSGLVLALPGILNAKECKLIFSIELGWQNIDIASLFTDLFGEKIYLERTINLLALAVTKARNKNEKASHVQLFIFDHSGIGVSTVIHGNIQHGQRYMHGELGHIKMPSNELCSCGQRGCLEAVIKKRIKENNGTLTEEILEYMAIGISTTINICDTDIVLTGSYINKMNESQKKYLRNAIFSKITSPDLRTFEIEFLYDAKYMAQLGLCTYMFDCVYPTT